MSVKSSIELLEEGIHDLEDGWEITIERVDMIESSVESIDDRVMEIEADMKIAGEQVDKVNSLIESLDDRVCALKCGAVMAGEHVDEIDSSVCSLLKLQLTVAMPHLQRDVADLQAEMTTLHKDMFALRNDNMDYNAAATKISLLESDVEKLCEFRDQDVEKLTEDIRLTRTTIRGLEETVDAMAKTMHDHFQMFEKMRAIFKDN